MRIIDDICRYVWGYYDSDYEKPKEDSKIIKYPYPTLKVIKVWCETILKTKKKNQDLINQCISEIIRLTYGDDDRVKGFKVFPEGTAENILESCEEGIDFYESSELKSLNEKYKEKYLYLEGGIDDNNKITSEMVIFIKNIFSKSGRIKWEGMKIEITAYDESKSGGVSISYVEEGDFDNYFVPDRALGGIEYLDFWLGKDREMTEDEVKETIFKCLSNNESNRIDKTN